MGKESFRPLRSSCAVVGYYGFGNAGDEMLLEILVKRLPEIPWIIFSHRPEQTRANLRQPAVSRWNLLKVFWTLCRCRALVLGGGELFQARTSLRSLFYYLGLIGLARICGCRVFGFGIAVDPSLPSILFKIVRAGLSLSRRLWIREQGTIEKLAAHTFPVSLQLVPDPVWAWPPATPPGLPQALSRVLWILRFPKDRLAADAWAPVLNRLHAIRPWEHGFMVFHEEEDRSGLALLLERLDFAGRLESWSKPDDILAVLSRYDAVVTMRYHGIITAQLAHRPWVAVSDHEKVADLARHLGRTPLPFSEITPEFLATTLEAASSDSSKPGSLGEDRLRLETEKAISELGAELT